MKTPQHLYRTNLAVADIMTGIFAFVPSIYFTTAKLNKPVTVNKQNNYFANQLDIPPSEPKVLEHIVGFVSWLSFLVSVFALIAASFDRVFATVFPNRYVKNHKRYVTIGVCAVVWVAPRFLILHPPLIRVLTLCH